MLRGMTLFFDFLFRSTFASAGADRCADVVFTPALGVDAGLFCFGFGFGFSFAKLDSKFVVFVSRRLC